jgi:multiple sugar transport system substrate-binding protein
MPIMTRRTFAALGLAVAALRPRASLASDTTIGISSVWGADKPFQRVVDAYNAERTGVTIVNRFDGVLLQKPTQAQNGAATGQTGGLRGAAEESRWPPPPRA